jgi:hypothetical protein
MARKLRTCSLCPGAPKYADTTASVMAHNSTAIHHYLALEVTGAPAYLRQPYYEAAWGLAAA